MFNPVRELANPNFEIPFDGDVNFIGDRTDLREFDSEMRAGFKSYYKVVTKK